MLSIARAATAALATVAVAATGLIVAPAASAAPASPAAATAAPTVTVTGKAGLSAKRRAALVRQHKARLAAKASTSTKSKTVVAGTVDATLTFAAKCAPMTLTLVQNGATLATAKGSSPVKASSTVIAGTLTAKVTGQSCRTLYTLSVVNTPAAVPAPEPTPPPVPTPSPTPTPVPTPSGPAPVSVASSGRSVLEFGARGDGVTDDTAAIRSALSALSPGDTLLLPSGYTFAHSDILRVAVSGVRISGGGTLRATNESRSVVHIDADRVQMDNVSLTIAATTDRYTAHEQMKLWVGARDGVIVDSVTVVGSAAAGIYVSGATNFQISNVQIRDTRADGLHMTSSSAYGLVANVTVRNVGDDGIAVVSYASSSTPCHHITVTSPRFYGQTWGRAFSVVGGEDITYRDIYAEHSNAASVYIAAEPSYNTLGVARVLVDGGSIRNANDNSSIAHGAVLVYSGQSSHRVTDVTVRNLNIQDTRTDLAGQVRGISSNGGSISRVSLENLTISGGNSKVFWTNADGTAFNRLSWTYNGAPVPDAVGWTA